MLTFLSSLRGIALALVAIVLGGCGNSHRELSMQSFHRAEVLLEERDYQGAVTQLNSCLRDWPDNYGGHLRLAWIYASHPSPEVHNGETALWHAERALELSSVGEVTAAFGIKESKIIGLAVKAAAEARMGDFEAAVSTQKMAIDALRRSDVTLRERWLLRYRSILEVYEAGVPMSTTYISPERVVAPSWELIAYERAEAAIRDEDFQTAVQGFKDLAARDPAGEMWLAWVYATCVDSKWRNPREAVVRAAQALERHRRALSQEYMVMHEWEFLTTLAAAYAEEGDFEKAVQTQEEALLATGNRFPQRMQDESRETAELLLELYKAGKPMRSKVSGPTEIDVEGVRELLADFEESSRGQAQSPGAESSGAELQQ